MAVGLIKGNASVKMDVAADSGESYIHNHFAEVPYSIVGKSKKYQFKDLPDFVAACEQFAEDLLSFDANSSDLTIEANGEIPDHTIQWLKITAI